MSDQQIIGSVRPGHYGVSGTTLLSLQEMTIVAGWNLQGDPNNGGFARQVRSLFGIGLPVKSNSTCDGNLFTAVWLGPASWLLIAGGPLSAGHPFTDFKTKRNAINAAGGALFDVSSSRVAWKIAGPRAGTLLASGCPLDFHPNAFANGSCAQSLFGHVGALICRGVDGEFILLVARSFARDVWSTLCATGAQYGYEVHAAAPLLFHAGEASAAAVGALSASEA